MLETIKDLYKFYLNHPIDGVVEVFPANGKLDWEWKKEKDQIFFRKHLSTELNFTEDDFRMLYKLDRSNYRCDKIIIEIHRRCDDDFTIFWTGYLALIDGKFNVDRCKVSIKPRIEDEYTCLLSNWNKEKDFIGGEGAPSSLDPLGVTSGIINEAICTQNYDHPIQAGAFDPTSLDPVVWCLDYPTLWTYRSIYSVILISYNNITLEETWEVQFQFQREEVTSPTEPFGGGWTEISTGLWVRPLQGLNNVDSNFKLNNGRRLKDVIQFLVDDCGLTFVSDFFNSNRDNTHPTNFAYDYAAQYLQDIAIFQKSDVKPGLIQQNATQNATKALIKLKDLLFNLNLLFNTPWVIDGDTLRIEHYTYFRQNQNMIDLTSSIRIKGFHQYEYVSEDLPKFERWTMMDKTDNHPSLVIVRDFDAGTIEYLENCSYDDENLNDVEYPVNKITNNIEFISQETTGKISDDGFVLVATKENAIMSSTGIVSGQSALNMPLSLGNLLYHLHRHGRPQRSGNVNGTDESFFMTLPTRAQPELSTPICCQDLAIFNPLHKIRTQLGWGFIDNAKFSDPSSIITFKLLHE